MNSVTVDREASHHYKKGEDNDESNRPNKI
jgi:hypothetical protein